MKRIPLVAETLKPVAVAKPAEPPKPDALQQLAQNSVQVGLLIAKQIDSQARQSAGLADAIAESNARMAAAVKEAFMVAAAKKESPAKELDIEIVRNRYGYVEGMKVKIIR